MAKFMTMISPKPESKILDVGGTAYNWGFVSHPGKLVLLNLKIPENREAGNYKYVQGDGRNIDFPDKVFDIVFSNSVIEHLSTIEDQIDFAAEVSRVGKSLWI